jgi:hypothetical protein
VVLKAFDTLPEAWRAYEAQRKPRAVHAAKNIRVLQEWLHLYDGLTRDKRDEMMKKDDSNSPMLWRVFRKKKLAVRTRRAEVELYSKYPSTAINASTRSFS